jgi:hypothetical protein
VKIAGHRECDVRISLLQSRYLCLYDIRYIQPVIVEPAEQFDRCADIAGKTLEAGNLGEKLFL